MSNYINNILKRGSFEFEGSNIKYAVNSVDKVVWFQLADICSAIQVKNWFMPDSKDYVLEKLTGKRKTSFIKSHYTWGIQETDVIWFLEGYAETDSIRGDRALRLQKVIKAFVKSEKQLGVSSYNEDKSINEYFQIVSDNNVSVNTQAQIKLTKDSGETDIKSYFMYVKKLAKSSQEYPVNLDDVWGLVYSRKDHAIRDLKKSFMQSIDYQVFLKSGENSKGGRPVENYLLTPACLEHFIARKKKEVFEVYRQVFHKVVNDDLTIKADKIDLGGFPIPAKFSDALILAAHLQQTVEVQEAKIAENQPKVEYYSNMVENRDYFTTTTIATELRTSAQILNQYLSKRGVLKGCAGVWTVTDEHQTLLVPSPFKSIIRWNHEGRILIRQLWEEREEELVDA